MLPTFSTAKESVLLALAGMVAANFGLSPTIPVLDAVALGVRFRLLRSWNAAAPAFLSDVRSLVGHGQYPACRVTDASFA